MLLVVLIAMVRGRSELPNLSIAILGHFLTIILALALTMPLLLQKRGTGVHRKLGWAWAVTMLSTAVISLFIHESGPGLFSPTHLLLLLTIVGVPLTILAARRHRVAAHRLGI
jgi:uncharacterized membrane protein